MKGVKGGLFGQTEGIDSRARYEPEHPLFTARKGRGQGKGRDQLKKRFLLGIARMRGGGLPMPEFFGPLSKSAFLVNKKSLFLQKCQCIELLTVF